MTSSSSTDQHEKENRSRWLWAAIGAGALVCGGLVFLLLTTLGESQAEPQNPPSAPLVKTTSVEAYGDTYAVKGNGFLEPVDIVNIVAEVAGKIAYVNPALVAGALLDEGDVLVRLDQTSFEARVAKAKANKSMAAANLQQARADYSRKSDLFAVGGVPEAQVELAAAQLATRKAQLAQAKADLQIAEDSLSKTVLRAPFDAVVDSENASIGSFVGSSAAIATLLDRRTAEVMVGLPRNEAQAIMRSRQDGQGVTVSLSPSGSKGPQLAGRVVEIQRALDRNARTVLLTVHVDNPFDGVGANAFFYGTYVDVIFDGAKASSALFAFDTGAVQGRGAVWRLSPSNTLEKVTITPVKVLIDKMLATGPLKAGDQLVLTGMPEAADGMKVRLAEAEQQSIPSQTAMVESNGHLKTPSL